MLVLDFGSRPRIICQAGTLLMAFVAFYSPLPASEPAGHAQSGPAAFDIESDTAGATTADLQERLEKDLRARRPVEFEFIAAVVFLVEKDELPLSLVNRCYLWARRHSTYPFQYFQRAIQIEAKKIGVDI